MATTYNVFISHSWSFEDSYYRILDYLDQIRNNYDNFDYLNLANPEPDVPDLSYTDELKVEYEDQINQSNLVIILSDLYRQPAKNEPNHIYWMEYAIEHAKKNNKPILAIRSWNESKTPKEIENSPDQWVDWNPESLKKAIENMV